jgi:hypothetical protein
MINEVGGREINFVSEFRLHAARAREAPAAQGFKQREDSDTGENESEPPNVKSRHATRDEKQRGDAAAHEASARTNVGLEKIAHAKSLARTSGKAIIAQAEREPHNCPHMDDPLISALGKIDQHALWASCLWGAIASGYWIYGWKQKMLITCLGGFAMTAVCFMSSVLWMSLASIAIMFAVWWLLRQGY